MEGFWQSGELGTEPGAERTRSYNGGYMKAGRKGEEVVMSWLKSRAEVIGIEDLTRLRQMREADVDCSLSLYDGTVALAEIKSDRHLGKSGKVLFEIARVNHTSIHEKAATLGWSARSPAQWLLFYAPSVDRIYRWRMDDYRRGFQNYTREFRSATHLNYVETDNIKSTINILIPEEYMNLPSLRIYELNQH